MDIPSSCDNWRSQMAAGADGEPSILQNILDEVCLDRLQQRFTDELDRDIAANGEPSTPSEALGYSTTVVEQDLSSFTGQGAEIPVAGFDPVLRLRKPTDFVYIVPNQRKRAGGESRLTFTSKRGGHRPSRFGQRLLRQSFAGETLSQPATFKSIGCYPPENLPKPYQFSLVTPSKM